MVTNHTKGGGHIKILIIADDFTGALDTGVKFTAAGVFTKVTTDLETDFSVHSGLEALVLCAPTRHLPPHKAYAMIRPIAQRAAGAGIDCIFKKTDSALRGNIGAELQAVLDGSNGSVLDFIPALPAMNRITTAGIHCIDGVPVAESVFGQDPFSPVTESNISSLIALQSDGTTEILSNPETEPQMTPCICVHDCTSQEEMGHILEVLQHKGRLHLVAGCAGLAESLPRYLGLAKESPALPRTRSNRLMVVCGSLNPISCRQLDHGEQLGYSRVHLPAELLLAENDIWCASKTELEDTLWQVCCRAPRVIIDSLAQGADASGTQQPTERYRERVAAHIGYLLKRLLDRGAEGRILVIGGDTLLAFLDAIGCHEIVPVCELQQGVVLSRITYGQKEWEIVTKSGGFGKADLLEHL